MKLETTAIASRSAIPAVRENVVGVQSPGAMPLEPYWLTIFLGAFLLFAVQLLLGKYFLPWFGGTPAMWTTCMFFFQVLLLAGYAYAHASVNWFTPRTQGRLHIALLLSSLLLLGVLAFIWRSPITPNPSWRPHSSDHPVWHLTVLLMISAGLPYFVLASTGPLLQSWFTRTHRGSTPYRLYSLSNLGSLLGLLTYPFLVEPWLSLRMQAWLWTLGFVAYALACAYCARRIRTIAATATSSSAIDKAERRDIASVQERPAIGTRLLWLGLAACASVMFLATTNQICQDVAVVPFLWVLPLSLYLLSFIICFDQARWYSRLVFHPALAVSVFLACFVLNGWGLKNIFLQVAVYSFTLFVCCMVCHGELARSKPASRYLTSFYLMIALGGAVGGVFVALIVPHIFRSFWEYHLGLWASVALLLAVLTRDKSSWLYTSRFGLPAIAVAAALLPGCVSLVMFGQSQIGSLFPALIVLIAVYFLSQGSRSGFDLARARAVPYYCGAALLVVGGVLTFSTTNPTKNSVIQSRNFYGVLSVRELNFGPPYGSAYSLFHGKIAHGYQFREAAEQNLPTGYYGVTSGVGMALVELQKRSPTGAVARNLRVGVVGLGVGTLSSYGKTGDYFRFYEINPEVTRIANDERYFHYLKNCPARVDVVTGDARLSMEDELNRGQAQNLDLLALDAFSGDAIPVHLLTAEAFEIYLRQISLGGIIAVHVTNTYFDLQPMLRRVAERFGLQYTLVHTGGDGAVSTYSDWILLSHDKDALAGFPAGGSRARALKSDITLWTDDYSNLFWALRLRPFRILGWIVLR